jgi:hypothetical protein
LSQQQDMSAGDDTSDESEWDGSDQHGTDDEEEEDSENGWLFMAPKLISQYCRQLPLFSK